MFLMMWAMGKNMHQSKGERADSGDPVRRDRA